MIATNVLKKYELMIVLRYEDALQYSELINGILLI